jgi:hypothetical protein
MVTRVNEAVTDYSNQLNVLIKMLKEYGDKSEDFIQFLYFRLVVKSVAEL